MAVARPSYPQVYLVRCSQLFGAASCKGHAGPRGLVAAVLIVLLAGDQTTLVSVWCFLAASGSLFVLPAILFASAGYRKEPGQTVPGAAPRPADSGRP